VDGGLAAVSTTSSSSPKTIATTNSRVSLSEDLGAQINGLIQAVRAKPGEEMSRLASGRRPVKRRRRSQRKYSSEEEEEDDHEFERSRHRRHRRDHSDDDYNSPERGRRNRSRMARTEYSGDDDETLVVVTCYIDLLLTDLCIQTK
jgi:hypothetical protein